MNATSQALVVPLNVLAFAVNEKDAHDATPYFSGANTVFTDQTGSNQAFLGANVNRSLMGAPAQPLQAGVHVHWAMPDALTKANTSAEGTLAFMATPNRWLVQRLLISGGTATRSSWVVLSDFLNDAQPSGQTCITLPTFTAASGQDYQYSGEYQAFSQQWTEPVIPQAQSFVAQTGLELSAVASGQSVFASFYPNCRGVFGFADSLADLKLPPNSSVELMYTVTGWYSNNDNDPLCGGLDLTQIQDALAWTFSDPQQEALPDYSLYQGSAQGVVWHPDKTYLPDYSVHLPQIALDLSLGNNPPESMSCYLQNKLQPTLPAFQLLLNAYFEGLLGKLQHPAPNQFATLKEELQENGFQSIKAEYIYTIVKQLTTYGPDDRPVVTIVPVDILPPKVGDALNLLNFYAQGVQLLQESLENYRWQLFADWYRIFMAISSQQQTAYNIAYQKYTGLEAQTQQLANATAVLNQQIALVNSQLPPGCALEQVPALRYWQANDPVFLLGGEAMPPAGRYGSNGQFNANGYLLCRLENQFITSATANKVTVDGDTFAGTRLPLPNALPAPDTFNALLSEALILNASLLSALCAVPISFDDVLAALAGQSPLLAVSGSAPSPLSLSHWDGNPWVPLFAAWEVEFQPVFATTDDSKTQLYNYASDFFTSQFTVEQNNGAAIGYAPPTDPASAPFKQTYTGVSILSTSAINGFVQQLKQSSDPVLQKCLQAIEQQNMVMQSLSGLNTAFLMQDQDLQLNIKVPDGSEYAPLTQAVAQALGGYASSAPNFNSYYNPVRAGFLKVNLTLIDIYGQKKTVAPTTINIAQSLTATYQGQPVPAIAYLPPRISQASRLLFRFLAADATNLAEMNLHPATTPICGWLLPNHLSGALFIYDTQGASLGALFLNDSKTLIMWQSAPGDGHTIDEDVQSVMQDQQPQLRDLVISLSAAAPQYFNDFMVAIDSVNGFVEPQDVSTNNDLAVLIGRPIAIVQTALTLELKGTPQYNQSWSVLGLDADKNPLAETDNDFSKVDFPVVLGDLQDLNDGLIGYFKFGQGNYDWANFYTMGAPADGGNGVKLPGQNTLTVKPYPDVGGTSAAGATNRQLLLIDPRAAVHATTGILPTTGISIPSDMYAATLSSLEMTFLTSPVLSGSSAFNLPLPNEAGYQWSWIQERMVDSSARWEIRGDVTNSQPDSLWSYTPQTLLEGWLRINPDLLSFEIFNADHKAILKQGLNDKLTLTISNRQGRPVTFSPAQLVAEGTPPAGSIFYLHFGSAVPQAAVAGIVLAAAGWQFSCITDKQYGSYWAASPLQDVVLAGGANFSISVDHLQIATDKQQIMVYADYYQIGNVNDGVYQDVLGIAQQ